MRYADSVTVSDNCIVQAIYENVVVQTAIVKCSETNTDMTKNRTAVYVKCALELLPDLSAQDLCLFYCGLFEV